jgi:WD40 repeat protein
MNFTELFQVTSRQCSFSPDSQYLASVNQYRLIIRSSTTLEIINLFACIDTIESIEWSYDSRLILAGLIKRNAVQIFSLDNPEWKCKIDEGSAGLCHVHWAPDSRHILTTAQFHLRITVWSLTSKNVSYIKYPKKLSPKSYVFSLLKPYMAVVERRNDSTDHISVFDYSSNWSIIGHFQVNEFEDLQGIEWSPNDDILCLWENCYEYKIGFYSLDGQLLNMYKPENDRLSLGVRCARWSPTGQVLVVGDYEEHITIFSYLTYKKIREPFEHPQRLTSGQGYTILKEEECNVDDNGKNEKR